MIAAFRRLVRGLDRLWQIARRVPPRQLGRRLVLRLRRPFWRFAPALRTPPPLAPEPPRPLLPARPGLARIEANRLRLRFPWRERPYTMPPDWTVDAAEGETARAEGNNLHYMEFLESLDDAAFLALLDAWIRDNPPWAPQAPIYAWRPYNLAVRVDVWMREFARRRLPVPEKVAASLAAQLHHLEHHLETDLRGNHLIRNLLALLRAAAFFLGPQAENWRRIGMRWLERELAAQILPDGCHAERSPPYHRLVLGDLLEICTLLPDGPLRLCLTDRLAAMLTVARLLAHPDGSPALFNDGGSSMGHPLATLEEAAGRLGIAPPPPPPGCFALPEAGYFGWRDHEELCVVDCGPLGPDHLVGHGHCDMLSFEWSTAGRRVVVDPGTAQYVPGPRRLACRGTAAHNTVTVPGMDQSDIFGAFRCGRLARSRLLRWEPGQEGFLFEGCHDGYARLPGRPLHRRWVEFRPGEIRIRDHLGVPIPGANTGILLHPDWTAERLTEDRLRLRQGDLSITIRANMPITIEPAEWYPDLHRPVPTTRLRMFLPREGGPLEVSLQRDRSSRAEE